MANQASEQIASRLLAAIERAFEPLLHFPMLGSARFFLASGLRVIFRPPYAIYYQPTDDAEG